MAKILLIELPYMGNLAFYQLLTNYEAIQIERYEFFEKASYRNRCEITGPNGKLVLSVPIIGGKDKKQFYKDTNISYEHPWLKDHWNSLCAAYRRSPYFEFYEDQFAAVYQKEHHSLFDFNWDLFELIAQLLKLNLNCTFTNSYQAILADNTADYRSYFKPKKQQQCTIHYHQVFEERTGFINNLSIVDLLFNEGPNAINLLKNK